MATRTVPSVSHNLTKLAVIAVCYNPIRYNTRYELYRKFQEHMSQSGVFLFEVECIFESAPVFGLPKQEYEITQSGNPRHLQLIAPSILWMKENLINIAVKHLPKHIEYVAWIDSDIEFERLDWAHLVIDELERYPIVQLFELAYFLGPNGKSEILRRDYSFAYSIKHNKPIDSRRYKEWYPHPGYAWAMRRTAFNNIGGLCEFSIVGSGDLHFAYALLNRINETLPQKISQDYRQLARTWGERVTQLAQTGHNVGYVPVNIYHHWHGNKDDRGYVDRWSILERHRFEPSKDLEKNPQTGMISLANRRHINALQMSVRMIALERDIVAYLISRKEDAKLNIKPVEPIKPKPAQPNRPQPAVIKPKPVATQSRSHFTSNKPIFPSSSTHYNRPTQFWTSGPAGSHVDYHETYWVDCTCPENHHGPHTEACPCCVYYENEHGHYDETGHGEHHHHHHHHENEHGHYDETGHGEHHHHHENEHGHCDETGHDEHHHHHHEDEHYCDETGHDDEYHHSDEYGQGDILPDAGEFDHYNAAGGENDSNDYGGNDNSGNTNDFGEPGTFY